MHPYIGVWHSRRHVAAPVLTTFARSESWHTPAYIYSVVGYAALTRWIVTAGVCPL